MMSVHQRAVEADAEAATHEDDLSTEVQTEESGPNQEEEKDAPLLAPPDKTHSAPTTPEKLSPPSTTNPSPQAGKIC